MFRMPIVPKSVDPTHQVEAPYMIGASSVNNQTFSSRRVATWYTTSPSGPLRRRRREPDAGRQPSQRRGYHGAVLCEIPKLPNQEKERQGEKSFVDQGSMSSSWSVPAYLPSTPTR